MTAVLAFLWNNKSWLALTVVVIIAGIIIAGLKIDLSLKTAEITDQSSKIKEQTETIATLNRNIEILKQNATAAKDAENAMNKVLASSESLKTVVNKLSVIQPQQTGVQTQIIKVPQECKGVIANENLEKINHCVGAFFRYGVLPEDCSAINAGAVLPKTSGS